MLKERPHTYFKIKKLLVNQYPYLQAHHCFNTVIPTFSDIIY